MVVANISSHIAAQEQPFIKTVISTKRKSQHSWSPFTPCQAAGVWPVTPLPSVLILPIKAFSDVISKVLPDIYISGEKVCWDNGLYLSVLLIMLPTYFVQPTSRMQSLDQHGIKTILNCASSLLRNHFPLSYTYHVSPKCYHSPFTTQTLHLHDTPDDDLIAVIPTAISWIEVWRDLIPPPPYHVVCAEPKRADSSSLLAGSQQIMRHRYCLRNPHQQIRLWRCNGSRKSRPIQDLFWISEIYPGFTSFPLVNTITYVIEANCPLTSSRRADRSAHPTRAMWRSSCYGEDGPCRLLKLPPLHPSEYGSWWAYPPATLVTLQAPHSPLSPHHIVGFRMDPAVCTCLDPRHVYVIQVCVPGVPNYSSYYGMFTLLLFTFAIVLTR